MCLGFAHVKVLQHNVLDYPYLNVMLNEYIFQDFKNKKEHID